MVNFLNGFNFNNIDPSAHIVSPCPDQLVGSLLNGKFIAAQNRIDIDYQVIHNVDTITNNLRRPIVIVLESPHKDEYDPITLNAIGPCMGKTGYNFITYFDSIIVQSQIYSVINLTDHDIVMLNAVQYQCSLGKSLSGKGSYKNKKQRDSNFIKCLNCNDLSRRISAINPYAIINLCTKGLNNLQQMVDNILHGLGIANYTTGNHPAIWWSSNSRVIN